MTQKDICRFAFDLVSQSDLVQESLRYEHIGLGISGLSGFGDCHLVMAQAPLVPYLSYICILYIYTNIYIYIIYIYK